MIYKVKIELERRVDARDEEEARSEFWIQLEDDNALANTTTENRLSDSMTVKKIEDKEEE